jgi:hypothetical protein
MSLDPALHHNRRPVAEFVFHLIRSAKYVIFADADIQQHDIELLNTLRPKETTKILNFPKEKNQKKYGLLDSHASAYKKLAKVVKEQKKNVFVVCDTRMEARKIKAWVHQQQPIIKYRYYDDADSTTLAALDEILHCDTVWPQFQVVIATPGILNGVDFSPHHFHQVFGFFKGCSLRSNNSGAGTISPDAAFRMMERIRHVLHKRVWLFMDMQN